MRPIAPRVPFPETSPLLVGNYRFVRKSQDRILQTVLVCKLYPFHFLCSIPVSSKGAADGYAVQRLASFVEGTGVKTLVYLSDQESVFRKLFEASFNQVAAEPKFLRATPDVSAVGESQSNGAAERSVQQWEDLPRTYKLAFEDHLGQAREPLSTHDVDDRTCSVSLQLVHSGQ